MLDKYIDKFILAAYVYLVATLITIPIDMTWAMFWATVASVYSGIVIILGLTTIFRTEWNYIVNG